MVDASFDVRVVRTRTIIQVPDLPLPRVDSMPTHYYPFAPSHARRVERDARGRYTLVMDIPGGLGRALVFIEPRPPYMGYVRLTTESALVVEIVDHLGMRVENPGPFRIMIEFSETKPVPLRHVIVTGQNAPRDPSVPKEAPQKCRTPACRNWSDQGRFDVVLGYCGPCDERRAHTPTWPLLAPSFARLFAGLAHPEVAAILASKESHLERPKVTRFTRREALARNRVKPKNWWEK